MYFRSLAFGVSNVIWVTNTLKEYKDKWHLSRFHLVSLIVKIISAEHSRNNDGKKAKKTHGMVIFWTKLRRTYRDLSIPRGKTKLEVIYVSVTENRRFALVKNTIERLTMTFMAKSKPERQTAKMKLLSSPFSCVYSKVKWFVFAMNSRWRYSIFVCFIYGLEE